MNTKHGKSKSTEYEMFIRAKIRARKLGVEFDLEKTDIVIPERCPILGMLLEKVSHGHATNATPSLDRLDPRGGYTKNNVWVISMRANTMKSNATLEQLKKMVFAIEEEIARKAQDMEAAA